MTNSESGTIMTSFLIFAVVAFGLLLLGGLSFGMMGGGMMGGAMGLGALFLLVSLVLVIWFLFGLADRREPRRYEYPPYPGPGGEFPMQVLDRKYANGEEISRDHQRNHPVPTPAVRPAPPNLVISCSNSSIT
jgi:uncharacterized membrane protein